MRTGSKSNCSICDHSFSGSSVQSNLKRHIESIHENKKHKCSICNLDFTQKCSLKNHFRSVHENEK